MQEVKPEDIKYTEVTMINKAKAEEAIKKAAGWAIDDIAGGGVIGYLQCLRDLGLI